MGGLERLPECKPKHFLVARIADPGYRLSLYACLFAWPLWPYSPKLGIERIRGESESEIFAEERGVPSIAPKR